MTIADPSNSWRESLEFKERIPVGFPVPLHTIGQDGLAMMEWECEECSFIISFYGTGRIFCRGDFPNKWIGFTCVIPADTGSIDKEILVFAREVFEKGRAMRVNSTIERGEK